MSFYLSMVCLWWSSQWCLLRCIILLGEGRKSELVLFVVRCDGRGHENSFISLDGISSDGMSDLVT